MGTFTATLGTAGGQTLFATDSTDSSIAGSSSAITISPTSVNHFTISVLSSDTPGGSFTFTVTAQDVYNNLVPSFAGTAGTIHFASTDTSAVLPANATLTSGVGTFSATLYAAGNQIITATDVASTGTAGSATVTMNPIATHFTVSNASTATAGNSIVVTVTAFDSFNRTATFYAGTLSFSSSDSQAGFVFAPNGSWNSGVGVFALTLKTAGTQHFTLEDGVVTSISGVGTTVSVSASGGDAFCDKQPCLPLTPAYSPGPPASPPPGFPQP